VDEDEIRDAIDRNTAALERNKAAFDRNEVVFRSLQGFMNDMVFRIEGFFRAQTRVLGELVEEIRDQRAEIRDQREESRAQTQALLRLLDRLGGEGSTA
jgi:hypothetical protein